MWPSPLRSPCLWALGAQGFHHRPFRREKQAGASFQVGRAERRDSDPCLPVTWAEAFASSLPYSNIQERGEADLPDQLGIDLLAFRQHFHQLLYFGRAPLGFFRSLDSEDDGIAVHAV